jgi:hypothetical protein
MVANLRDFGRSVLRNLDARKLKPGSLRSDLDAIAADHAALLRALDAERSRNDQRHQQALTAIATLRVRLDIYRDAFVDLVDVLSRAAAKASDELK